MPTPLWGSNRESIRTYAQWWIWSRRPQVSRCYFRCCLAGGREVRFSTDEEREAARLKLAGIIVTLGKYHHDYVTAELQARAIEVFDMWPLSALPP